MSIKAKAVNLLLVGFIGATLIHFSQEAFNKWYPINHWINFVSMELQDTNTNSEYQILYSTRNVREPLLGDFMYKTYCIDEGQTEEYTTNEMYYINENVPLEPTGGKVETKTVQMLFPYKLNKGTCRTFISAYVDIGGIKRLVNNFETSYKVQ
jgi:hypothetical protein